MARISYRQIKSDLLDQLEINGTAGKYYLDLVDDYINLLKTKNELQKDIDEKGVSVKYQNGSNQWGYKKNDSVDQLLKVNAQQLKILDYLNLKPAKQDFNYGDTEM